MQEEILRTLKGRHGMELPDADDDVDINIDINEQKLLAIIADSPKVTIRDMAEALGVTQRQCERIVAEMKRKNLSGESVRIKRGNGSL